MDSMKTGATSHLYISPGHRKQIICFRHTDKSGQQIQEEKGRCLQPAPDNQSTRHPRTKNTPLFFPVTDGDLKTLGVKEPKHRLPVLWKSRDGSLFLEAEMEERGLQSPKILGEHIVTAHAAIRADVRVRSCTDSELLMMLRMPARCQSSRMATKKKIVSSGSKQGWPPGCFWECVCVCVCMCTTSHVLHPTPVLYRSSKWGSRYERSVTSSSIVIGWDWNTAEVTCTVIGWPRNQWKTFPSPLIPEVLWNIMCAYNSWFCFVLFFACIIYTWQNKRGWEQAYMRRPPDLVAAFYTNTGYLIPHEATLKNWGQLSYPIHTRWVTATSPLKFYGNQLILQKEWASQLKHLKWAQ